MIRALPARTVACVCAAVAVVAATPAPAGAWPDGEGAAGIGALAAAPLSEPARKDAVRADQWQLKALNVEEAWHYSTGEGVVVAVVDSGVDADHRDLNGQVLKGKDLVDTAGDGDTDLVGHGTTVSGIIAGSSADADGVVGIAPKAKILPVRVLDRQNKYDDAMIVARGVRWAVDNGASVVNLSLGGNGTSPALAAAIDYAFAKDVVVVACTGNSSASSTTGVWYPAREPGVIAVAGMGRDGDTLWPGSITGKETVVTAPATELTGARPGGYWQVQGTSFAAPMVSATAALIRSRWPGMSAGEVVNRIIKTATDKGTPGHDDEYGYGVVNPTAALTAEIPGVQRNPLDTTASPGIARIGSAPSSGQAQSAPDTTARRDADVQNPGSNGGAPAFQAAPARSTTRLGWWAAATLFLISLAATLYAIRRFANAR
jgi:serine protease